MKCFYILIFVQSLQSVNLKLVHLVFLTYSHELIFIRINTLTFSYKLSSVCSNTLTFSYKMSSVRPNTLTVFHNLVSVCLCTLTVSHEWVFDSNFKFHFANIALLIYIFYILSHLFLKLFS